MSKKRRKRKPRRPRDAPAPAPAPAKAAPAKRSRPAADERPPAPWGSFPLVEIAVLLGIVLLIAGFISGGSRGNLMIGVGIAFAAIGGLELAIREHFAGFRSHSLLLAGFPGVGTIAVLSYSEALPPAARLVVSAVVFGAAAWGLAMLFRRKAGVAVKIR